MNRGSTSVGGCSVGMQDVTTALNSVDLYQGRKRFVGPRDAGLIRAAEDALGVQFPPTYRAFLERLGAGSIRGPEVYGVIDADFQESTIPGWHLAHAAGTPRQRTAKVTGHRPQHWRWRLRGDRYLQTADSENPMVPWHPGVSTRDEELEEVSNDFGQFFLELVRETTD